MSQGGISLLAMTAENADDPQTLRMIAGAIANLCGNGIVLTLKFKLSPFDINFHMTNNSLIMKKNQINCS